ncbi:MAG: hypothetical protein JW870_19475 [Candidatus Delongbacteria bacterium]|nr:hypothetical protein [Candidatus Delongbacteria bacterium]
MKETHIETKLNEIENRIEHLKTPALRAESMISLLNIEQVNSANIDLIKGAQAGLKEMFSEIEKVELSKDINNSISILNQYLNTNSFDLFIVPGTKTNEGEIKKFEYLNERIEQIVMKYDNNPSQFL